VHRPSLRLLGGIFLASIAVAMLAYRFADLDLAAFILDEPKMLSLAHDQLVTGRWATHQMAGTQGIAYGPSIVWFYGVVQRILGPDPLRSIFALCLTVSLAHLALALGLARLFGGGLPLFATVLAWIASSPYQFFWSRTAWDLLVNASVAVIIVILARSGPVRWKRAIVLGLVLGFAVSSHLMVVPFTALVLALVMVEMRAGAERPPEPSATPAPAANAARAGVGNVRQALAGSAALGLGIVFVNIPYFTFLLRASPHLSRSPAGFSLGIWAAHLLQPARVGTVWGADYFFEASWWDFQEWLGEARMLLRHSALSMAFGAVLALLGIAAALRSPERARRRIALLAAATWLVYPFLYALRGLAPHPHYQFPTWWVIPFGIAGSLAWLRPRRPALANAATALIWLVAAAQFAFVVSWVGYIRDRDGTRGGYGTPVGSQQRAIRSACAAPESAIVIQNETALRSVSLRYIASVEPGCAAKQVSVCVPGRCAVHGGSRLVHLRYAGPEGGALAVD